MLSNISEKNVMDDFRIQHDLEIDITYCQISLRYCIKVHQALVRNLEQNPNDTLVAKRLNDIEHEILDIGREQSELMKQLHHYLDEFIQQMYNLKSITISKDEGNEYIAGKLYNAFLNSFKTIRPINVKLRKTEAELLSDLILNNYNTANNVISLDKMPPLTQLNKQVSLLKPKEERMQPKTNSINLTFTPKSKKSSQIIPIVVNAISFGAQSKTLNDDDKSIVAPAICNSRLNLLNALNKAKNQRKIVYPPQVPPPQPVTIRQYNLTAALPSSSSSSSASSASSESPIISDESYERIDMFEEIQEDWVKTNELKKEDFLKMFSLFTHEDNKLLQSRRRERKRRNVTSTEKTDFHYGRFDLLERKPHHLTSQLNKRGKPVLYSPPATRGFKKRKQSHDYNCYRVKEIKIEPLSSSSSSSSHRNFGRNCIVCNKYDNSLQICLKCSAYFHIRCHRNIYSTQLLRSRDQHCPHCIHMNNNYIVNSQQRAIKYRNKLKLKNEKLQDTLNILKTKYEALEHKLNINYNEKNHLLTDEIECKNKMQKLVHFIGSIKGLNR